MNLVFIFKVKLVKFWDCYISIVISIKEYIIVLFCFNVIGQFILLFIFFLGKCVFVGYNLLEGVVFGSVFVVIEKGYMDAFIFYLWFVNYFIFYLFFVRLVVFLVDSVEVYIDFYIFELVKKNNIYIFALLKNIIYLL